ncbi:glycerol-3-phosphate 1-O-acyltransferase PlsY [Erythrobacter sp. SDW2]|uniref:glycerol-3-phosphate 1-O-acyltransferase PlsY n=1 Tax=Erythrobacter sp. SDW2 TaxID=2907154 RepID=UPI001F37F37D|nr:glycerol-3-phosphate 1-O-acyltransferase PlsY [Erythrobacter sp. SDW2]UIP06029.1 glycerol-3-phosphate 1-O-acyltransferase PlsY [Erythrobacter sp. SDW2]
MDFNIDPSLALLLGYAFGSVPFGLILTRMAGMGDVREIGSGNIGATNVLRTGNKGIAAATLLLDGLKGFVPVFLAWGWFTNDIGWAALGAVLGHCFPVWLGFKGGKGVATTAGVCFGLGWPIGLTYAVVWLGMLALTRISSLAGMSAAVASVGAAWYFDRPTFAAALGLIAVIVLWLHRENIGRLRRGEEPKVGSKS